MDECGDLHRRDRHGQVHRRRHSPRRHRRLVVLQRGDRPLRLPVRHWRDERRQRLDNFFALGNLYGQIDVKGNVTTHDTSIGGSGTVNFNGTGGTQTITADANAVLPNVNISSGAKVSILSPSLTLVGDWTNAETFTAGTGTVKFTGGGTAYVDTGSSSFYNVDINRSGYLSVVSPNGKLKVNNDLTITGVGNRTPCGAITVGGDLSSSDPAVGGNADITMIGGGTAKI